MSWLAAIGRYVIECLQALGHHAFFFWELLRTLPASLKRPYFALLQVHALGNLSLLVILSSGLAVGFVLALQSYYALVTYGAADSVGLLVNLSLVRELGPVVTALLFAGRAGTALTSEIGLMRATDQLTAQTISGDLGGNAVAEGAVSGRRGAGAGAWRFTGARAVMKAAGPVTLTAPEGSLAQGVHGADTIRARSLTVDPEKKNYQAAGAVELHQDLPLRRALAAGETLEVNEIGGVGLMTGAVALDLFERAAETLPFLPSFKARGKRADMKLKDGQLTQVILSSPDHSPVFCESPAYRVSGQQITYRLLEGAGEVTAAPPARVTVLNLENHQTLYGNRAEIRNAGKEVIITSEQGTRTRKDTAGAP